MKKLILISVLTVLAISCQKQYDNLDTFANNYIKAVLAVGNFDKDYVDAYFGPDSLKKFVQNWSPYLDEIAEFVNNTLISLKKSNVGPNDKQRKHHLLKMLSSVKSRIKFLQGEKFTFDEESRLFFDIVAPSKDFKEYDKILDTLNNMLPGEGTLTERYENFKSQFIVSKDKIDTVFKVAIEEGKRRTKKHIKLPENEKFILEYVTNRSWGGYNWFKGNAESLIQINLDLPIFIDRAISLACHEGYPGHHVYHSLIDEIFVEKLGWVEYSIYPLFSPEAVLSEGSANYGITVAFPGYERIEFEKNVLFPLAGLDTTQVDKYYKIKDIVSKLDYATVDIARLYLDGKINDDVAIELLMKYKLRSRKHAQINLNFFKQYRAYIITYYIGEELCKNYVESKLQNKNDKIKRWEIFKEILTKPMLPSDLK